MNVYKVVSEPISYQEIIDPEIGGPWYDYRIAELVAAPSRGRAKWLAWQSDGPIHQWLGIEEMPKFSVHLMRKGEDLPEGLHSGLEHLWLDVERPWEIPESTLVDMWFAEVQEQTYDDSEVLE